MLLHNITNMCPLRNRYHIGWILVLLTVDESAPTKPLESKIPGRHIPASGQELSRHFRDTDIALPIRGPTRHYRTDVTNGRATTSRRQAKALRKTPTRPNAVWKSKAEHAKDNRLRIAGRRLARQTFELKCEGIASRETSSLPATFWDFNEEALWRRGWDFYFNTQRIDKNLFYFSTRETSPHI